MEESFPGVACRLQISLWTFYRHSHISVKGTPPFLISALPFYQKLVHVCILLKGMGFIEISWQKERKKKWDEKNQEAISEALKNLNEFDKVFINFPSLFFQNGEYAAKVFIFSQCYMFVMRCDDISKKCVLVRVSIYFYSLKLKTDSRAISI